MARPLGRNESISPVWNIVTKVRMNIDNEAVDMFCFRKCSTVAAALWVQAMLLTGLQYALYSYYCIFVARWQKKRIASAFQITRTLFCHRAADLASNYNPVIMVNVNHGFLFVLGEERITLLDDLLSICPAR